MNISTSLNMGGLNPEFSVRRRLPLLISVTVLSVLVMPANMVFKPLGAVGTVPMLLSLSLMVFWVAAVLIGIHDPIGVRHPGRIGLGLLWLATCVSYIALYSGLTGGSSALGRAGADRWMILIFASSGLILVITEVVQTLDDVMALVRTLLAGAFICCLVAVVQFSLKINPMEWIQDLMVGFTDNEGNTWFQNRGSMTRVAGSTFHPIELAVISAMLIPLSVWRAIYDRTGRAWIHWLGTALLVFALASTVSRSSILGLIVSLVVFVPFLPKIARRWALVVAPFGLAALFLMMPGLIATLFGSLTAGDSDPSITTRTNNYPRVAGMLADHPVIGIGPGTYQPTNALYILDNQYLNSAVTMGLVGLIGVAVYLTLPAVATLQAARAATTQPLKALAGAVAAAGAVACFCSLTFDSMAFPVFALTYPIIVGLSGAVWALVRLENRFLGASMLAKNN